MSSNSERVIVDFAHYEEAVEFAEASGTTAEATVKHHGLTWLPVAQLLTFLYFAYFLIIIPLLGLIERPKDEPESIADSIHKSNGSADAVAAE